MELPDCPNSRGGGCENSRPKIEKEGEEFWSFICESCKCIWVVSKQGVTDKSKFENAMKRRRQQEHIERIAGKRRSYFT